MKLTLPIPHSMTQYISVELPNERFLGATDDPCQAVPPRRSELLGAADDAALHLLARRLYQLEHGEGSTGRRWTPAPTRWGRNLGPNSSRLQHPAPCRWPARPGRPPRGWRCRRLWCSRSRPPRRAPWWSSTVDRWLSPGFSRGFRSVCASSAETAAPFAGKRTTRRKGNGDDEAACHLVIKLIIWRMENYYDSMRWFL